MLTVVFGLIVICVVIVPYLAAPLLIRLVHKQPSNPRIEQFGAEAVPPDAAGFFRHVADSLAAQDFAPAAYLRWDNPEAHIEMHLLVLSNAAARESAAAIDMRVTKLGATHFSQRYVEFCTEFANGEEIGTLNSHTAYVTKPDPLKRLFRFPSVQNPLMLYGAHRQLVDRHAPPAARFIPTPGTEHLHLAHGIEKANRRQVEFGYMYLDEAAGAYRPTLRGAFMMTWKLAWPVKQVRAALAKKAATETLHSLGA